MPQGPPDMDNDGTLNNVIARARYERVVRDIPSQRDRSASREEQARQTYRLRHEALWQARALMSDPAHAAMLKDPIAWDDLVAKYQARGQLDDALWQAIIDAAARPGRVTYALRLTIGSNRSEDKLPSNDD
jgi:hypothetical protein